MIGNAQTIIQWLFTQDREKQFEVKEHREKRSLDSNAYAWTLINKIGNTLNKSKEEVYFDMLKHYGQSTMVSIMSNISVEGYFKYFEKAGESVLNEKEFTHYKVYKGSSEFDSKEMSVLIDGVIQEAKQLNIETLPPKEIERLNELWQVKHKNEKPKHCE